MRDRRQRLPVTAPAKSRARSFRTTPTLAEQQMWEILRDRRLEGIKFRRQSPISMFIVDFHCRELNLVVELDGEVHADRRQVAHDENRDSYLRSLGCTILRFRNDQIFKDLEAVRVQILESAERLRERR